MPQGLACARAAPRFSGVGADSRSSKPSAHAAARRGRGGFSSCVIPAGPSASCRARRACASRLEPRGHRLQGKRSRGARPCVLADHLPATAIAVVRLIAAAVPPAASRPSRRRRTSPVARPRVRRRPVRGCPATASRAPRVRAAVRRRDRVRTIRPCATTKPSSCTSVRCTWKRRAPRTLQRQLPRRQARTLITPPAPRCPRPPRSWSRRPPRPRG